MSDDIAIALIVLTVSLVALVIWFIVRVVNRRATPDVIACTVTIFLPLLLLEFILADAFERLRDEESGRAYFEDSAKVFGPPDEETEDAP
jgi:hypothetical protein